MTRAIQKLEEELGGLLFRRERNLTHLTDLGHLMRPHLEQVLRETEAAKTTAGSFLRLSNAPLNLGIMCTIGPLRFIGFLNRFRTENPGIELTLMEATPVRLSGLLTSGQLDVAVMAQPDTFDERLVVLPLYRERFMVALPPGHRFESRNALTVEDTAGMGICFLPEFSPVLPGRHAQGASGRGDHGSALIEGSPMAARR